MWIVLFLIFHFSKSYNNFCWFITFVEINHFRFRSNFNSRNSGVSLKIFCVLKVVQIEKLRDTYFACLHLTSNVRGAFILIILKPFKWRQQFSFIQGNGQLRQFCTTNYCYQFAYQEVFKNLLGKIKRFSICKNWISANKFFNHIFSCLDKSSLLSFCRIPWKKDFQQ